MTSYRVGWLALVGFTAGAGVLFAMLAISSMAVLALAVVGALTGAAVHRRLPRRLMLVGPAAGRRHTAAALALGLPALAGLVAMVGPFGAAAVVVLELAGGCPLRSGDQEHTCSPPILAQPRVGTHPHTSPHHAPTTRPDGMRRIGSDMTAMTDEELSWAWRFSFTRLQRAAGDTAATGRISQERQAYLDEIERRAPAGFAAWMDAGALATSDPRRYLDLGR